MFAQLNSRHTRSIWLLVIVIGNWSGYAKAEPEQPPLLKKMAVLQCTHDLQVAAQTINTLFNINAPGVNWPDEWLGAEHTTPALHAGTLDIMLHTLGTTTERFPSLREDIERVALQWNYCDVLSDTTFFNLSLETHTLHKQLAATDVPLQWQGFKQWGFLTPDPPERFVPRLLDEIRLAPLAYQYFLHRIYRKQCFPHPETGLLATEAEAAPAVLFSRVPPLPPEEHGTPETFPYAWDTHCPVTQPNRATALSHTLPALTAAIAKRTHPLPIAPPLTVASKPVPPLSATPTKSPLSQPIPNAPETVNPPLPPTSFATLLSAEPTALTPTIRYLNDANDSLAFQRPVIMAKSPHTAAVLPIPRLDPQTIHPMNGHAILPTIVASSPMHDIPIFFDDELDTNAPNAKDKTANKGKNGVKQGKKTKKKKLRLAGNIADTYSLKDGSNTLSASATWSPKENWFVSGNASIKDGKLGYSWSAGYSDWRPGTWSAQVNNYGPIAPGKGLDLNNASASVGYKVKSATLDKYKLNASAGANINAQGKGSVNATVQWNPKPKWYARTTASIPLEGGAPTWSYGFGYSDPRPNKWRVEYSNYGNNQYPGDNLKDGSITISRGWQF